MGVREDIRENPAVNVIFSLQRIGIKNRARTQMTLVYTQCIFVVQISKMIFLCFSTIFTSKIHIYKTYIIYKYIYIKRKIFYLVLS